jgi:streptogramin lyase
MGGQSLQNSDALQVADACHAVASSCHMTNQTRFTRRAKGACLSALALAGCAGRPGPDSVSPTADNAPPSPPSSAEWLALLPDGEEKRRFVLDCTGCHQFDQQNARPNGRPRTRAEWRTVIARMLTYAGATTRFPVISAYRNADATADWLSRHLTAPRTPARRRVVRGTVVHGGAVAEFMMPDPHDLPHDVAVDRTGQVVITGMMTHRMYVLDPVSGRMTDVDLPVQHANPRAVEIDPAGNWWVVLGAPNLLARYEPASRQWRTFAVGMYAHSVALDPHGRAWTNGHFTRAPEMIASVDVAVGLVTVHDLPLEPRVDLEPGGPIPYEIRVAPDGRVWMSELQGNRLVAFDPTTRAAAVHEMPTSHSGPRRFDIDARGVLWIPAYATNELVRYDATSRAFRRFTLPIQNAVPYVVRVDPGTGIVWIGTSAADAVLSFDQRTSRFTVYDLPTKGALVRHLAIDPRTHDVWVAYGASPGIPARVARITPRSSR